jgi:acetyltransferase
LHGRFHGGTPRLTPALLSHLTRLDYVRRFALVAADAQTRHGVAIARYEALDEGVAEVAVAVDPAWRQIDGPVWPHLGPMRAGSCDDCPTRAA